MIDELIIDRFIGPLAHRSIIESIIIDCTIDASISQSMDQYVNR
jgi:hypothetical protein